MDGIVGVISDTHGLLRPEALEKLKGSDLIIHAGDIGGRHIIDALQAVAPVRAVRGNVDTGLWALSLPQTDLIEFGQTLFYAIHDVGALDIDPAAAGVSVVISGHSHRPALRKENGILLLNPGSAGPRRLKLPVSMARIVIQHGRIEARLIEIDAPG